jgi:hypothetical protein
VDSLENARVGPARTHAEAPFDLVRPADRLARDPGGDAFQRRDLPAQPPPAVILEVGALKLAEEHRRLIPEAYRVDRNLGSDFALPLARSEERVDEAIEVTADAQGHSDVALGMSTVGTPQPRPS